MSQTEHPPTTPATNRRANWPRMLLGLGVGIVTYLVVAYLLMPALWKRYESRHPAIDDLPGITETGDKHPGDPINVALIGDEEPLKAIMKAAGWFQADPLGVRSDLKIAADTVLKRPYSEAPVSNLFLFGRKEDLAFEQPVGDDPRRRHHVRFWKCPKLDDQGRPLWAGSVTYDKRVGLSHTTGQITHHISGDVDEERDRLFAELKQTGDLGPVQIIDDFHRVKSGRNGGGDMWETDGRLLVGTISK
jgi:hypothetical protein